MQTLNGHWPSCQICPGFLKCSTLNCLTMTQISSQFVTYCCLVRQWLGSGTSDVWFQRGPKFQSPVWKSCMWPSTRTLTPHPLESTSRYVIYSSCLKLAPTALQCRFIGTCEFFFLRLDPTPTAMTKHRFLTCWEWEWANVLFVHKSQGVKSGNAIKCNLNKTLKHYQACETTTPMNPY